MRKILVVLMAMSCLVVRAGSNPYLPYMATAHDTIDLLISRDYSMRYGYMNFSSQNEKLMYMQAVDSICHFTQNWRTGGWTENRVTAYPYLAGATNPGIYGYMDLLYRLKCDMPEMWVMSNSIPRYTTDYKGYQIRLYLGYTPSLYAQELVIIDSIVSGVVEKANLLTSEYEKVLFLHDTLCQITRYGDMSGAYAGTIKGVFVNHRAVCEGWARAFQYLCQKTGIWCLYIDGRLNTNDDLENPSWGNHAWNYVMVDGQWYLVDATTDGALGTVGHRAFLKGQNYADIHYSLLSNNDTGGLTDNNSTAYPTLPTLAAEDYVPHLTVSLTPGQWNFLSFPVDVEGTKLVANGNLQWGCYNSETRAGGVSGWTTFSPSATPLRAGQGYICYGDATSLQVYIDPTTLPRQSVSVPLRAYTAVFEENANWNFVGNPFNAELDVYSLTPAGLQLSIWNGSGYDVFVTGQDHHTISPFGAFFIQTASGQTGVTFAR